jgi:hypothetical protein
MISYCKLFFVQNKVEFTKFVFVDEEMKPQECRNDMVLGGLLRRGLIGCARKFES